MLEMNALFTSSLAVPVIFALIIAIWIWTFSRGRHILDRWAADNRYQIVSSRYRWLPLGPFFWKSSRQQMVYYVVVKTMDGQTRRGWVRCGSFLWGVIQYKAKFVEDNAALRGSER